jgi:hydroxymethylglutaryl-CoA synthase
MSGLISYGTYVPYFRLDKKAIATSMGAGGGKGTRAVASYDEDTTSMGVEAARNALAALPGAKPHALVFATTDPPYLDKTNANAIHAALDLPQEAFAVDAMGSVRSGVGALFLAAGCGRPTLAVLSDRRTGLPTSADEANGGDAAVALLFGTDGVVAELVAQASSTAEFLDRWRAPGTPNSQLWEERFGETMYVPLAQAAITDACKQAGITVQTIDHLIVSGTHARAVGVIAKNAGANAGALIDDLTGSIGNAGVAAGSLMLCTALDRAGANQTIVQVSVADGVDVLVWRTTTELAKFKALRTSPTLAEQIAAGDPGLSYNRFLSWKGEIRREPPRRPDFDRPSAPAMSRDDGWKFPFTGSRCTACGTRHLPPQRVCVHCRAVDQMEHERLADVPATIATFTIDRLAFSPSPPAVFAVIDFDGGGRFSCELTDVDPNSVAIGQRVEMTFRRLYTAQGIHNYFWKARPIRNA